MASRAADGRRARTLGAVTARGVEISDGGRAPGGFAAVGGAGVQRELHEQRAWWTRAHVTGEVARLIANPTPEAITVETERIIAMCVPLEVDDNAEYADWGAAKYTSTTIQKPRSVILSSASEDAGHVRGRHSAGPGAG